jgi:ATP-dependent helicase Lhr and Lhr-like helicase
VSREAVAAEGIAGGYASVYPVLRAMEESGRARRGYFVAGLGAAQFALPGAVDRLRAVRDDPDATARVLAATDPAQPYGAAIPWPRGPGDERLPLQRASGAYVVIVDGRAVLYLERGGRSLLRLPVADDRLAERAVAALPSLVASGGPLRELRLERIDRAPVAESLLTEHLAAAGFRPSYRGWLLRRPDR